MARIAGVHIPTSKPVEIGLTYVFGIGRFKSQEICESVKIDGSKRVNALTDAEIAKIRTFIETNCIVEGELRRQISVNIKRLIDMKCFRGLRHRKGFGKTTKSVPIAGKKMPKR